MSDPSVPARVAVVGVGLMGASLGLALKKRWPECTVIGHDSAADAAVILSRGAVDTMVSSLEAAVHGAEVVFLCTPLAATVALLPRLAAAVIPEQVVTDVAGAKVAVMAAARSHLDGVCDFIGGHPMTGSEQSGAAAATADLFTGAAWVLCPGAASAGAVTRLRTTVTELGAEPVVVDARTHDRAVAVVSHLPQLLAVALLDLVDGHQDSGIMEKLAAGGFADLTRIGSSSFAVWEDVLQANREAILVAMQALRRSLENLGHGLQTPGRGLEEAFRRGRDCRQRLQPPSCSP